MSKNPLDWNPYDWLIGLETMVTDIRTKHNKLVKKNDELIISHNILSHRVEDLELQVKSLEKKLQLKNNVDTLVDFWEKATEKAKQK
jgi:hypothetical protein